LKRDAEIINSNYGRDDGWTVEKDGTPIATLTDARGEEMFWVSYKVEVLVPNAIESICGFERGLVFRNRRFQAIAPYAFPSGSHSDFKLIDGRLIMRALYLTPQSESIFTRLYAWKIRRSNA
jgi:hypothetical protein